jgi:hypothetical protein
MTSETGQVAELRGQQLQRFFGGESSLWIR